MGKLETAIRYGLAAASIAAVTGCTDGRLPLNINSKPEAVSTPEPYHTLGYLYSRYPESKNLRIRASYAVQAKDGIPTTIHNASEFSLNMGAITSVYNLMQEVTSRDRPLAMWQKINGNERKVVPFPRPNTEGGRLTIIIPPKAPRPTWKTKEVNAQLNTAVTAAFDGNRFITFIAQDPNNANPQEQLNDALATEICQQAVMVVVLDAQNNVINDRAEHLQAQERYCNTIGTGVASRLMGIPYEVYEPRMSTATMHLADKPDEGFPLLAIPKRTYESIPQGLLIR